MANPDEFSKLSGEMYRQWEKSMATWWDKVLEHPSFLKGMSDNLETTNKARKGYEESVDKSMADLHLPSRKDVVRVARVASMLEDKLLGLEDQFLAQGDTLTRLEKDSLQARVDAAETMIGLQDRLSAIEARLEQIATAMGNVEKPVKTKRS